MTGLSVNVNKIATLRNSRGGNYPDVLEWVVKLQSYRLRGGGAVRRRIRGITVHPRPDERHITYADARAICHLIQPGMEYNIEGYPSDEFIDLVLSIRPDQVTLVPDAPDVLTSDAGWDVKANAELLKRVISNFRKEGIRVSLFMDADVDRINELSVLYPLRPDRVELYTGPYAEAHRRGKASEILGTYRSAVEAAMELGLCVNAGHDLSIDNLGLFLASVGPVEEVSIGHALICEALEKGYERAVLDYLDLIGRTCDYDYLKRTTECGELLAEEPLLVYLNWIYRKIPHNL